MLDVDYCNTELNEQQYKLHEISSQELVEKMIAAKQWAAVLKASKEYGLVEFDAATFVRQTIAACDFSESLQYLRTLGLFDEKTYLKEWRERKKELKKKNDDKSEAETKGKFSEEIQPLSFPPAIVSELIQAMIDASALNCAMVLILKYGLHGKFSVVEVIKKMIAVGYVFVFIFESC